MERDELRLYTLAEVAELLRVPYRLVRDAVYRGRWPHVQFSPRTRRMSAADIRAVQEQLHQEPTVVTAAEWRATKDRVRRLLSG